MTKRTKGFLLAVAALLIIGAVGYWSYDKHRKQALRSAVVATLQDVSPRMREALTLEVSLPPAGRGDQLEQHSAAVGARLLQLEQMDGKRDRPLVDAAVSYVLTVREILRQQTAANGFRLSLSESMEALRKHMRDDDRTDAWIQEAVVAKAKVDKHHRDYRIAAGAFNTVLDTLTAAQTKIASHVDAALLCDIQLISEARNRTLKSLSEAAAEFETIKQLESHR